ncbi:hypothetical protein RclHR1_04660002 [Rhizophagus clarus]|uniref:Kinase-like domain-containing protein n=1 Tax=Rhizophagus clarus TaxID=94130 RepID=A0A2Z6SCN6_9GLOM|nr:hypothetical protein RclHR1_04660002 [Rhizophagus clarus]GES81648.1 kinase-like domain-containing protein [Rhizophagus clarus]
MELTKILNDDSFDPTPKLKSSPIPISFISFNRRDYNCIHCGEEYTESVVTRYQRYCKKCLSCYLTNISDINIYLDVYVSAKNLECSEHVISRAKEPQSIQECYKNCLEILCFKQIVNTNFDYYYKYCNSATYNNVIESEKNCKLCGKSLYQGTDNDVMRRFKLCSDCYLISSECIESTLTKKSITIIYLPWWHNDNVCRSCYMSLKFTSDSQKYCENCFTFYIGCRYCLTTSVVFGITNQTQCKKCKRVSSIIFDVAKISSGNRDLDDFLNDSRLEIYNQLKITEFTDKIIDSYFFPNGLFESIYQKFSSWKDSAEIMMEWIPYSQFTNVEEIAKGGFGIIYLATWLDGSIEHRSRKGSSNEPVILKKFKNSQDISKYFLNELKSNQYCYKINHHVVKTYGFTKDPNFDDYILVMKYASGGDLYKHLQKNFASLTWNKQKLVILWQISEGLETIHKAGYIHRDFHSGNILFDSSFNDIKFVERHQWLIGDLGLSQPANSTSSNNEIYGVIPYIAPEIFKGSSFSKKSDVYCISMIMWELTTGCKPFANVEHDINLILRILDGERPEITEDTPECFANLMKRCWNSNPKKRPSIREIRNTFGSWSFRNKHNSIFDQAEIKREELIALKKLGPEFSEKPHPSAVYTSRLLNPFISKCSSTYSSNGYVSKKPKFGIDSGESEFDMDSKELEFDIASRELKFGVDSKELEFDIDIRSNAYGTKRKIEEININSHGNNGKSFKISSSYLKTSHTDSK